MKKKILIIDDEQHILQSLDKLLSKESNYEVDTAVNFKEALDKVKNKNYHLVILDHSLGSSGERDMVGEINDNIAGCGIIVISGYFNKSEIENYKSRGVVKCMKKPFTIYEVRETVRIFF